MTTVEIKCAYCERTQRVRPANVTPADEYRCDRCEHDPELRQVHRGPVLVIPNAAGAFAGLIDVATSPLVSPEDRIKHLGDVARARALTERKP